MTHGPSGGHVTQIAECTMSTFIDRCVAETVQEELFGCSCGRRVRITHFVGSTKRSNPQAKLLFQVHTRARARTHTHKLLFQVHAHVQTCTHSRTCTHTHPPTHPHARTHTRTPIHHSHLSSTCTQYTSLFPQTHGQFPHTCTPHPPALTPSLGATHQGTSSA